MFSEVHFRNIIFIQNNVPSQSPAQRVSQFTHPIKVDFWMFAFQICCEFVKNKWQPQIAGSILNANDRNSENTSFRILPAPSYSERYNFGSIMYAREQQVLNSAHIMQSYNACMWRGEL